MVTKIIKRDGRKVAFNIDKISKAIFKAAIEVGGSDYTIAEDLAQKICEYLEHNLDNKIPTVEQVQDATEKILIEEGHAATAKAYILYRAERTKLREMKSELMKTMKIQLKKYLCYIKQ
jgi:ribonucleoside-triphosphate reductase